MTINLIKLAVGVEDVAHLAQLQKARVADGKKNKRWDTHPSSPRHITRQHPRRKDEVLDNGSIYWVIKGAIRARQRIISLDDAPIDISPDFGDERAKPKCAIVLDPTLVPTQARPHRAFQGWRYLETAKAPKDEVSVGDEIPANLALELDELGLL